MPKQRLKQNKGLPSRWVKTHGAYYYRVPTGLEHKWDGKTKFRLGKTLVEAYKSFAERVGEDDAGVGKTIGELLDKYLISEVPKKAVTTQAGNRIQISALRRVFGEMPLLPFPPKLIYQYVDKRDYKIAAHREVEVLSHAYTKAVEWGLIDRHPFKGEVRLKGEKPRDRYVEDWEIEECFSLPNKGRGDSVAVVQSYIRLKLLTGLGRGDLLRLEPARQFKSDGIHVQRHKTKDSTGKKVIYSWTPALREAVENAIAVRPVDISPFLFCTRRGKGYINEETGNCAGWKSLWQRFYSKVIAETRVEQHFTEHDLRAKVASDAESLQHATELLAHADPRTTQRIYRRKATKVNPSQ